MSHDSFFKPDNFFTADAPVWMNDTEGVVRTNPTITISETSVNATTRAWMMSMAAFAATSATNYDAAIEMAKTMTPKEKRTEFTDEEKAEIAELSGKEKKRRVAEIRAKYKAQI